MKYLIEFEEMSFEWNNNKEHLINAIEFFRGVKKVYPIEDEINKLKQDILIEINTAIKNKLEEFNNVL